MSAEAKIGDLVRVVRPHSEGVDKYIGTVEDIRNYGGFLRYYIRLRDGKLLNLDSRVIKRLDIVTGLAMLDPEFQSDSENEKP